MVATTFVLTPPTTAATPPDVLAFGDAPGLEGTSAHRTVAAAATADGRGLLLVTADGHVDALGTAVHRGEITTPLSRPIVDAALTPSGDGYWLFAADGGVFTFGPGAAFYGSTGDQHLNQPIVAAATAPRGDGYWLVARDGGVFTFGLGAAFFGSTGDQHLNQPIVDAAAAPRGDGYWLLAGDGGVFTFGPGAGFHGSAVGALPPGDRAVAIEPTPAGRGYWIVSGPGAVRLAFAGDVHAERHLADQVRRREPILEGVDAVVAAADVAAVNLETPLGPPGTPQRKEFVFLAPAELASTLSSGGVDVVNLANNHALDHGPDALVRTLDIARGAGLRTVGAGRNAAEAYAPAIVDVHGTDVAFLGLSQVVPPGWAATATRPGVASAYDLRTALQAVRAARQQADAVVVLVHWGVELARCPNADVTRLADALHDAGATVVAGHHPHVLQGIEVRPGRVTAFSLGNFVWYHNSPPSDLTGVLDVTVDPLTGAEVVDATFHPARITDAGRPQLIDDPGLRDRVLGGRCV